MNARVKACVTTYTRYHTSNRLYEYPCGTWHRYLVGTRTVMVLVKYHVDVLKIKYRYKNTYKYQN